MKLQLTGRLDLFGASVCLGVAIISGGCESTQKTGSLNAAVADYNAMRYTQAHQKAAAIQEKAPQGSREDAAYVAGLSAYQLGSTDDAEQRLWVATRSTNPETAARAKAMLGQIRMDQYRPRDAANLFTEAAPHLQGEDARRCAFSAAVAYQQAGDLERARNWVARSHGDTSGFNASSVTHAGPVFAAPVPQPVNRTVSAGGFTLQVGAFREKRHAQQAAADAQPLAVRDGLGPVRILTRKDERGAILYVVQFGTFPTRDAAATARAKLGRLNYIVAPASSS